MSRTEKQTIRNYIQTQSDVREVRVASDGAVRAHGTMPNTNTVGWYFVGWAEDLLAMARSAA